jgi:hypothetical protein
MRTSLRPHRIAIGALTVALMFGITACTDTPTDTPADTSNSSEQTTDASGDDGQSVEEACGLVQDTIENATSGLDTADVEDPSIVVDAMRDASAQLDTLAGEVTNDQISALIPDLGALFTQMGDSMEAALSGDADAAAEFQEIGTEFQTTLSEFQEACGA